MELINRLNRECVCVILNDFYGNLTYPELGTRHIFYGHRVMFFFSTCHRGVFSIFFHASSLFVSRVIQFFQTCHKKMPRHKISALKTCFNADTRSQPAPIQRSSSTSFLEEKFTRPAQWSSSTLPAGGQPHPSLPVVIFHPSCWRSNSPAIGVLGDRSKLRRGLMKRGDERREMGDGRGDVIRG